MRPDNFPSSVACFPHVFIFRRENFETLYIYTWCIDIRNNTEAHESFLSPLRSKMLSRNQVFCRKKLLWPTKEGKLLWDNQDPRRDLKFFLSTSAPAQRLVCTMRPQQYKLKSLASDLHAQKGIWIFANAPMLRHKRRNHFSGTICSTWHVALASLRQPSW